jgi:Asp-tRNA(Asn)/Glu-tRNA(Gln) amidotransferase A subunit family amidase
MLGKGVMSACDLGYALLALLTSTLSVNTHPCAGGSNFGKANLDQFASGLVGTRTPYGVDPPTRFPPDPPSLDAPSTASATASKTHIVHRSHYAAHLRPTPPTPALPCSGGINFGKTNLDQFASGLVGTRTPYGVAPNAFDSRFIPGGSSSGSAAAVGAGLLTFALGTDTAGSGRVPAGYNGCVGLKGSLGKISTVGEC